MALVDALLEFRQRLLHLRLGKLLGLGHDFLEGRINLGVAQFVVEAAKLLNQATDALVAKGQEGQAIGKVAPLLRINRRLKALAQLLNEAFGLLVLRLTGAG